MITREIRIADYLPQLMKNMNNWVLYALYPEPLPNDPNHKGKYPIDPKPYINRIGRAYHKGAKSNDPTTWGSYTSTADLLRLMRGSSYRIPRAIKSASGKTEWTYIQGTIAGLGFELDGSGITCIDIDNCADQIQAYRDGRRGGMVDDILSIAGAVSYVEISQSGKGLHIFIKGRKTTGSRSKGGGLEIYDNRRFIAMTGNVFCDFHNIDSNNHSGAIEEIQARYLPPVMPTVPKDEALRQRSVYNIGIRKAVETAIRTNRNFAKLWAGDRTDWINDSDPNGNTRSDQALCNLLCFYLWGDYDKIDTAFRNSRLMRPKWDELRGSMTYGEMTINKSIRLYEAENKYFDYAAEFRKGQHEKD